MDHIDTFIQPLISDSQLFEALAKSRDNFRKLCEEPNIIIHIDGSVEVDGRIMTFEEFELCCRSTDWHQQSLSPIVLQLLQDCTSPCSHLSPDYIF